MTPALKPAVREAAALNIFRELPPMLRVQHPTCFFTEHEVGRQVYFEGYADSYMKIHAVGRATLFYSYNGALE